MDNLGKDEIPDKVFSSLELDQFEENFGILCKPSSQTAER